MEKKRSGLGTASLVLGIIGVCISFIPIINNAAFVLGILVVIFGIISLAKKCSKAKAIVGLLLGISAIVFTIIMQMSVLNAVNDAVNELDKSFNELNSDMSLMTGESTDDILEKYLDVTIGNFTVDEDEFFTNTKLDVKVKNKSKEKESYSIMIEAVDGNGTRITYDTVYVNNLGAGQSQNFEAFNLVSSEDVKKMKKANFKIVEVSMY